MSTIYSQILTIIVSTDDQAAANALAATVRNNPADGSTFQPNASSDGSSPATTCISGPTPVMPACADNIINNLVPQIGSAIYYLQDAASGNLLSTNATQQVQLGGGHGNSQQSSQNNIGSPWSVEQTLTNAGIVLVTGSIG